MKKSDIRKDGRKAKGFTLIELLVVVVIIGILAAVATPIYLNQRKAAWKSTAISDTSTGTLAVESARTQAPDGSLSGVEFGGGQDGQPMTITLGGSTSKAPVSPGNTETAWTGKDSSGQECYAVMTTNKNVGSEWAAVRTSVSGQLTTGTPPANGSADCPRPAAPSSPDDAGTVASKIHLSAYIDGGSTTVPVDLELTVSGSTARVHVISPGSVVNGAAAVSVDTVAGSTLAVVSVAEVPVSGADPTHPVSMDWWSPNPLIVGLANGASVSIDVAAQTATVRPAA